MWKWFQGCRNSKEEMPVRLNKSRQTSLGSWLSICWVRTRERGQEGDHIGVATVRTQRWSRNDWTWYWETDHAEQRACTMRTSSNTFGKIETCYQAQALRFWVTSQHSAFITLPNTYWMFKIACKMRKFYLIREVMGEQHLSKSDKYIVLFPPTGPIFKLYIINVLLCILATSS